MSFSIVGKTAIVTGSASGIGLAIARQLAAHGANVMCADEDETALQDNFADSAEDNLRYFGGNLRERLTIANLISATLDAYDRIDILVNASRRFCTTDPLDTEDDSLLELMDSNLRTTFRLTQAVAKRMIKQGVDQDEWPLGIVVNLSSTAASRSHPDLLGFSVAAAATNQLTRSLALALAPHRIRVNAVALGSVLSASL